MKKITIGNVEVTPLQDTAALMNPAYFFPGHADQIAAEYRDQLDERGLFSISITSYLVRSAGKNVLIDTGVGNRKRGGLPVGRLDETLRDAGIDPADIDLVVHTHLHIDHVGWNTIDDENGDRQIFFPRAQFLIQQQEWDYWMQPKWLDDPAHAHLSQCVKPLENTGRIRFMTGEQAIDDNLVFVPAPGHTPGHVVIGVQSAGDKGVIIGDASHHPLQIDHPDWSPGADWDPVMSGATRDHLFDEAADDGRKVLAGHWDFPGYGNIVRLNGKRVFRAL